MRRSSVELMDKLDRARDGISVGHGLDERGMNGLGSVHGRSGGNGTGIPRARGGRSCTFPFSSCPSMPRTVVTTMSSRKVMDNRTPQFDPQTSDIRHPYALSTSIKLLLDSPEHVWHCVDKEDFLGAARLEGVARVVYRELVGSGVAGKSKEAGVGGDEEADPGSEDDEDEEDYNIVVSLWSQRFRLGFRSMTYTYVVWLLSRPISRSLNVNGRSSVISVLKYPEGRWPT